MAVSYRDPITSNMLYGMFLDATLMASPVNMAQDWVDVVVWDEFEKIGRIIRTGRESYSIDATADAVQKYLFWITERAFDNKLTELRNRSATNAIQKGVKVRVTSGRHVKELGGKPLLVFHVMNKVYSKGPNSPSEERPMLGLALSDEMETRISPKNGKAYESYKDHAWVWLHNVELDNTDLIGQAQAYAAQAAKEVIEQFMVSGLFQTTNFKRKD